MYWRERGQHQHHQHAQTHRAQDGVPHTGAGGAQPEKGENKIGHSSRSSSIQRSKTTEEVSVNVKEF